MIRNGISYNLWAEMINSRKQEVKYEVDNAFENPEEIDINNRATGYPNYYTAVTNINNEHYGITTLLLGHDPENFNIDKKNKKHIFIEFDARSALDFDGMRNLEGWGKFNSEHIGYHIESYYPKDGNFTENQKKSIDEFGNFINSDINIFKEHFDLYLDKNNLIDMYLHMEFVFDWDGVAKDLQMVTYDSKKWYILPWDKDTSFGLWWEGNGLIKNGQNKLVIDINNETEDNKLQYRIYKLFKNDIEKRYQQLRDINIFSVDNIEKLSNNIINKIPEQIWEEENLRWNKKGRTELNTVDKNQVLSWTKDRLEMLDKHFNYK